MEKDTKLTLDELIEKRIQENFDTGNNTYDASDERLKEMNKKLPSWSLEPPFSYLK